MLLKADFEADWVAEMRRIMTHKWAMNIADVKREELPALFFHALERRIEPRPREVVISSSFICPAAYQAAWLSLMGKIEAGDDLSSHLSLGIEKAKGRDSLLLDWGVYHLHLGVSPYPKHPQFVDRTGPLVFGFPTYDAFHAIGVYQHGAWSDSDVIEVMNENWPCLTQPARVQVSDGALFQRYTDADRQMLRSAGINLITPLSDGSLLFPLGGSYSGNGISARGIGDAERERQRICRIQDQLQSRVAEVVETLEGEGGEGVGEVCARLNFDDGVMWISFEGFSATMDVV